MKRLERQESETGHDLTGHYPVCLQIRLSRIAPCIVGCAETAGQGMSWRDAKGRTARQDIGRRDRLDSTAKLA